MDPRGAVAERLGRGLQSLVHQFESGRRLSGLSECCATSSSAILAAMSSISVGT